MNIQGKTAAEIVESVRTLVQQQTLRADTLLPPVRDLAAALGVNRNTVAAAYRRLVTLGVAVAQGRLGTRIRPQQQLGEQEGALPDTPLHDLASGNPHLACLPDLNRILGQIQAKVRLYGVPTVNPALEAYLHDWFKPDCPSAAHINLTHGAVDAIERVLSAHLLAGDKVAVEDPCFLSSINSLHISGFEPVGVALDEHGVQPDSLREALEKGAQAVILTPRAHNPTGVSLTHERAQHLARVLDDYPHVLVILDDHFALLAQNAYYSVLGAQHRHWALIRSLSKTLGPDIRVAAVASDAQTSGRLRLRLASGTNWVSHILQDIVEAILLQEQAQDWLLQAKAYYGKKRQQLEAALSRCALPYTAPGDGLNLWIPLHHNECEVMQKLAARGWLVRQGSTFSIGQLRAGLRLTLSDLDAAHCERFAQDLQDILISLNKASGVSDSV